jgi:putative serine protease PepD
MSRLLSFVAGVATLAVVLGVLAVTGVIDTGNGDATATTATAAATPTPTTTQPIANTSGGVNVADVYARVSPGVVFVENDGAGGRESASGSGFVIDDAGHIVTNEHVVDGASALKVRFGDNGDAIPVKLLGADRSSDLAVLQVDPSKVPGGLHPLQLGSSSSLRPGEPTIAIGSPFGLEGTVTSGIVSALNRTIQAPSGFSISGAIQTDAAINPGNSGGPLLNADGQVIGVNSQIATESGSNSGVGFAIPVDQVKQIVPVLEKGQRVQHAYLGVASSDAPAGGAQVGQVVRGGPADKAGLRAGDRIVQLGGEPIHNSDDLSAFVNSHQPGEKVQVVVERGGQRRTLTVTLGTQPQQAANQPGRPQFP